MLNSQTPPLRSFICVKRMTAPKAPHLHFMPDSSVHPIHSFIQAHLKVCYLTTFVTVIPGDLSGIIDPAYLAASIIHRPPTKFYLTHFSHMCVTSQATLVFQGQPTMYLHCMTPCRVGLWPLGMDSYFIGKRKLLRGPCTLLVKSLL